MIVSPYNGGMNETTHPRGAMKRIRAGLYALDGHTIERINGVWFITFAGQSKPDEWESTLKAAVALVGRQAASPDFRNWSCDTDQTDQQKGWTGTTERDRIWPDGVIHTP